MESIADDQNYLFEQNGSFSDPVSEDVTGETLYGGDSLSLLDHMDFSDLGLTNYPDQTFDQILQELLSTTEEITTSPQVKDVVQPVESNDAIYRIQRPDDHQLEIIENNVPKLSVTRSSVEPTVSTETSEPSIPLSESVLVTMPSPTQLHLVNSLEETFRPRYKSDYFPQKGAVRHPRYVADKHGNHYVTIQIPSAYRSDLSEKYLRIALITTNLPGRGHFYSPYKFQIDNEKVNVPDQNPMYIKVSTSSHQDYKMKLHLVLIKSKLDELRSAQPLIPFAFPSNAIQNLINNEQLTPKELINRYRLEKSHIAFTLCSKMLSGLYEIHSDTTVLSSVITEFNASATTKTNSPTGDRKTVCCPNCSHQFAVGEIQSTPEITKKKRKSETTDEEIEMNSTIVEKVQKKRRKKAV